jgi:hypothetical protein
LRQFGRCVGEPVRSARRIPIFEDDGTSVHVAAIAQPLPERLPLRRIVDNAHARNFSLLRTRRERPRGRRAAEQRHELAAV